MRIIGRLFMFLVAAVIVLILVAFALPREITVSRSVAINTTVDKIFPLVNDLRKHSWSPWVQLDPDAKFSYSGPPRGKGQKVSWQSQRQDVGTGSQTITKSETNKLIETALDFSDQGTATAGFDFKPEGKQTNVTWRFKTDAGNNPVMRWMGLMFDSWIGENYEKGLANLKKLAEKG